jgi:mannose-6-phosphate isomerase-like protein (cupin superfamily)
MRAIRIGICALVMVSFCGVAGIGQTTGGQELLGGMVLRLKPPADRAVDWPATKVTAGFNEMVMKKLESQRILEGGAYNFNLRRETAPEPDATAHGKKADLYLIRSGEATLTTGGQLINPKPPSGAEGDVDGSGIRNGTARVVKTGDVVFIPPGVAHQITAVNGEVQFLLFRWDTREAPTASR